jgi:hypothetical protein
LFVVEDITEVVAVVVEDITDVVAVVVEALQRFSGCGGEHYSVGSGGGVGSTEVVTVVV